MDTLFFLLTALALLATLIALPVTLVTRHFALARVLLGGMLVWLAVYIALLGFAWFTPATVRQPGQEVCFDEMCFSVTQANRVSTTHGTTVTVTVQLRNASLRTAQKPDSPILQLVDGQGRIYQPSSDGEQPVWSQKLQPGETQVRALVFKLLTSASNPVLTVTEGSFPAPLIIGSVNSPFHKPPELLLFP